ncbi:flagellar hook-associated protein FlgK [Sulfuricella denitrificans skB26]|uniref:Flagellar hook-associated protein 1 n=1 Tax=Sulfuricella denitrificans (strain DSM 22764 / NBRC 105220 / skB26) TaxID=1163617 RepID=S6AH98_SULDS|nr:flagellar hook-associated protein FlgK [Sulfuricella denitrificans]BAN35516.1 flagellar hook-associated protein FlgK [Sulfuricella denitrificans skB26]
MSTYSVGVSALNAAQAGLTTTSHNISNVNTPGFHRQQIVQSTKIPQYSGIGFLGQGTQVDTVKRLYNNLLDGQVMQAQAQSSQLDSYYSQIRQIDNMLADPNSGLSPALQDFFNGVQDVAANPASVPSRQAMLSSGQTMVSRFQAIDQRFSQIRDGVNSEIRSSLEAINTYAQQIANMNQQIGVAQSSSGDLQPANDLLDQRDQMLAELNKLVKVSTVKQSDGSLSVFIGNGQTLVINKQSFALAAVPSLEDPERFEVGLKTAGNTVLLSQGSLQGGSLGGILAFRSETLDAAQNQLGRVAIGLAQTFNDQHQLGVDLNGAMGTKFFNVPPPKVIPNSTNPAGTVSPTVKFNNVAAVTTSDYRLSFSGASWSLLDATTGQAVAMTGAGTAASPYFADGLSIEVPNPAPSGAASFLIKPTINGARDVSVGLTDPAKIAAAAPIRTEATLSNTGSGRISAGTVNSFNDKVTIKFNSASDFDVVDNTSGATLAKNVSYTSGSSISYNGWTVNISNGTGAPAAGDVFTIDKTVTSTSSTTATIGMATPLSPPVDPNLSSNIQIIFGSSNTYHLAGRTNNFTGQSTVVGTNGFMSAAALAAAVAGGGSNPGFTGVAGGTTSIGTGAGSYTATGTTTTISGGTISGPVGTVYTITGATLTVGNGTSANTSTVSGLTITVDTAAAAGTVTIQDPATATNPVASTFTYTGKPATGSYVSGQPISFNGWTAQITGSPVAGDTFTVGANAGGVADNRNALLLAGLQTQNTLAGGTVSYQSAYSQLVSMVGNKTHELDVTSKAQTSLVAQTQEIQQSLSGVNLDEEAANLMRYQQAYQAAGKMMQIASTLFDTLLSLGR